jgi:L-proline cis-4-hydroxylase
MSSSTSTHGTRLLAKVPLDPRRLADTIAAIARIRFSDAYSDFACGKWETCVLRNPTGRAHEAIIRESDHIARPTEIGRELPYLEELIEREFDAARLRWARLMRVAGTGCVIPHVDFLEFSNPYTRLHLCLATNAQAWNSEDHRLIHMREGEIWHLDATRVHSAVCFSHEPRVHLVLDFIGTDDPESYLAHPPSAPKVQPDDAVRPPMPEKVASAIAALGDLISEANFRDVVSILAKMHFYYDAHAADMFDWLRSAVQRSGDRRLEDMAAMLERTCVIARPGISPVAAGP